MRRDFGFLQPDSYSQELKTSFLELWRLLAQRGVLIFKWSTLYKSTDEILKLFPVSPLFGQVTANLNKTVKKEHVRTVWFCFMKIPEEAKA
jgi:hypothetical protein